MSCNDTTMSFRYPAPTLDYFNGVTTYRQLSRRERGSGPASDCSAVPFSPRIPRHVFVPSSSMAGNGPYCKGLLSTIFPAAQLCGGVLRHFLIECPGRDFLTHGAACAPNLYARPHFSSQVLSRFSAMYDTVWGPEHECMDAECNVRPSPAAEGCDWDAIEGGRKMIGDGV